MFALPFTPSTHAAVLDQSVEFEASAGARELHLSIAGGEHGEQPYDFPNWRFAGGGRLRRLVLSHVGLAHQRGLEGLAQLDLTRVAVDDATVTSILAACGALTVLELKECDRLVHVAASHHGLRVLNVDGCGSLESIAIESTTLLEFAYRGHKVDITYRHAPTVVRLIIVLLSPSECPLDCVDSLPKLKQLFLQFPSPLHQAQAQQQAVHHGRRFERLNQIVLIFKTPWRDHVASVASLLVAAPSVKELRVEAYSDLPVPPPKKHTIQWPRHCSPKKLESIVLGVLWTGAGEEKTL